MFTHGANVRKTTTLTKFSRGRKCDQTLNSRKFAWSGKYGQNPSFKQVCSGSTSDQTHIFVQFFAQVANIIKSPTLLGPANVVKSPNIEHVCSGSKYSQSWNIAWVSKCF